MSRESANDRVTSARQAIGRYHRESGDVAGAFRAMHDAALADGELSRAIKELMAVAVAIVTHCSGCAAWHLKAAAEAGASRRMVIEMIDVAVVMGGGPAMIGLEETMGMVDELYPA